MTTASFKHTQHISVHVPPAIRSTTVAGEAEIGVAEASGLPAAAGGHVHHPRLLVSSAVRSPAVSLARSRVFVFVWVRKQILRTYLLVSILHTDGGGDTPQCCEICVKICITFGSIRLACRREGEPDQSLIPVLCAEWTGRNAHHGTDDLCTTKIWCRVGARTEPPVVSARVFIQVKRSLGQEFDLFDHYTHGSNNDGQMIHSGTALHVVRPFFFLAVDIHYRDRGRCIVVNFSCLHLRSANNNGRRKGTARLLEGAYSPRTLGGTLRFGTNKMFEHTSSSDKPRSFGRATAVTLFAI